MGSQAKSNKNSKFLENVQDRTLFLRKVSQGNHVRRMSSAREKGETLQANFIKPSNSLKFDFKLKPQNDLVVDSKQRPEKKTNTKDSKRYPYDNVKNSKLISHGETNELKVPRETFSPFVMLSPSEQLRKAFCFPDAKSPVHKFPTQSKVETPKKLFRYGNKIYQIKSIKENPTCIKSNKRESPKKYIEDKLADDYQAQNNEKPPRLKNVIKSSKHRLKSKIQDLDYEQDSQYHKEGLCEGSIRCKTCFDESKINIYSPKISRPNSKKNINRNDTNQKLKNTILREFAHPSSGDSDTLLRYTRTDLPGKKCSSSEIYLCERPGAKVRSSSLDPLGGRRFRSKRELSPVPVKSKIPIATTRIKQVRDSGYETDKVSKGLKDKKRQKSIDEFESKLVDSIFEIKVNANRRSLHDRFSEKQKCTQTETEKKSFEFPFNSNAEVCNEAKASECYEAPSPEPSICHVSDYNLTDWSEFAEKFDQEYKKDNNVKAHSTDLQLLNENKTLDKPDNGPKNFNNREFEKYMKDLKPSYDFLQSPIEKLMKEINSAINLFNTDEIITDDEPLPNLSGTAGETPEKGQRKKKVKNGRKSGGKKKTVRRGRV